MKRSGGSTLNWQHEPRRIEDLKTVLYYCDTVEEAFSAEQWEKSTLMAVQLGIAAHKAFMARPT